jgi:cation diffusion facilitator family transporter
VVNLALTSTQIVAGVLTKSQGLVADGVHSLSDLIADFVVLFANHHSQKDADEDHPYGHHRYETAASLVLGLLLLAVGLGMLWSAAVKLEQPEAIPQVHLAALWVALGALTAKELLFRYMLAVAKRVKSSMLVANAWHARSDAASSLVVGLGIIGNLAGYPILDPIAAAIVGFMVTKMGWEFGWDALHDLMDRAVDDEEVAAIRQTLAETPGIMACTTSARARWATWWWSTPTSRWTPRSPSKPVTTSPSKPSSGHAAPPRAEPDDPCGPVAPPRWRPRAVSAPQAEAGWTRTGLSDPEAAARLRGTARTSCRRLASGAVQLLLEVVREPMFLLLVACGVIYWRSATARSLMLLGFVGVVIAMTFVQKRRSQAALDALRDLSSPRRSC